MNSVPEDNSCLMLKNLFELPDIAGVAWEEFRAGIKIHRLYETPAGTSAAMLRYAPGAALQRHVHVGYEHILILRGSQVDDAGEHVAGTLIVNKPGSSHTVHSPDGCVVLIIWERPVVFVAGEKAKESTCEIP